MSDIWLEIQYINQLGPRFRNFRRKSQYLWNFSCPLCGDSPTRKHAARGFIYKKNNQLNFCCKKCGAGMSARNFIAAMDPAMFKEMQLDSFTPTERERYEEKREERPVVHKDKMFEGLIKVSELPKKHYCREYVVNRFIPEHVMDDLYFTDHFYTWSGRVLPGRYKVPKDKRDDEPRLVIPFRNAAGDVTAFQGRALKAGQEPKYVYVALTKDEPLIWGLNNINPDETIYVFEGPIDAMFVPNAIACGGGDLSGDILRLKIPSERFVIVYDNEPRNSHTIDKIQKAINRGFAVCLWPETPGKDVNEIVKNNIKFGLASACEHVLKLIQTGTSSGITANILLNRWNKSTERKTKWPMESQKGLPK